MNEEQKPTWYNGTRCCIDANLHEMNIGRIDKEKALNQIMAHIQTITKVSIINAEHPYRQLAIRIIEEIIEPCLLKENEKHKGVEGKAYYELEDKIVSLIARNKNIKTN